MIRLHIKISFSHIIHFLGEGTIAPAIYRNSSGSRGYLYYRISNRDHVFVKFESDFPVNLQALSQDVMVGGEIAPWENVFHFLAISLPLVFVVLVLTPSRVRRFFFARPRRVWAIGMALFLILVGWGSVLFLGPAIYGFSTSGLAIGFLLMVVLIAGSSQIFTNGRFRPRGLAKMAKGALFLLAPFVVLGVVDLFWLIPYVGSFLQSLFAQVIGLVFFSYRVIPRLLCAGIGRRWQAPLGCFRGGDGYFGSNGAIHSGLLFSSDKTGPRGRRGVYVP